MSYTAVNRKKDLNKLLNVDREALQKWVLDQGAGYFIFEFLKIRRDGDPDKPFIPYKIALFTKKVIPIIERLEYTEPDFLRNLMLLMPRETFKTYIISAFCAYMILKYPNYSILMVSAKDKHSTKKANTIKRILKSDRVKRLFGDITVARTLEDKMDKENNKHTITSMKRTSTKGEPNFLSMTIKSDPQNYHVDMVIFEDIIGELYKKSLAEKETVDNAYKGFQHVIDRHKGVQVIIGTRYHIDDLYGRLIKENENDEEWEIIVESAENPDGTMRHPQLINEEDRARIKKRLNGDEEQYASQYLNSPVVSKNLVFNIEEYERYTQLPSSIQYYVMGVDPAGEKGNGQDKHSIVLIGVDMSGKIYLVENITHKGKAEKLYNDIVTLNYKYRKVACIIVENNLNYIESYYRSQSAIDKQYFNFRFIRNNKRKIERIRGTLLPALRNKYLILPDDSMANEDMRYLFYEMRYFDSNNNQGNKDDNLDALEMACRPVIYGFDDDNNDIDLHYHKPKKLF